MHDIPPHTINLNGENSRYLGVQTKQVQEAASEHSFKLSSINDVASENGIPPLELPGSLEIQYNVGDEARLITE